MAPTVVIDPGHGGAVAVGGSSPNNAVGPNGLLEKDVTLDLARRVAALLSEHANVVLTRTGDENRSLSERARVARDANASVFLSLHLNGWKDPSVDGSEAWIATHATAASRALARAALDRIVAVTHARDRGVKQQDFGVLLPDRLGSNTAATLLELAFLTNPDEATRLAQDDYKQSLAQAIAAAVTSAITAPHAESLTTTDQQDAIAIVEAFRAETSAGDFSIGRNDVADRAIALINDPSLVDQASLNLCGPAALHRLWIDRDPKAFARYVTSLYDTGEGDLGSKHVKAGSDLRHQDYYGNAVPAMQKAGGVCPAAEWVAMSSLRDYSNTFLDFEGMPDEDVSGITTPGELAAWLRATGLYADVTDDGNWFLTRSVSHAEALTPDANTDVAMLINAHILTSAATSGHKKSDEFILNAFPNHFVVLRSRVTEPTPDEVEFDCWTWGHDTHVRVSKSVFGANYYGAVIARVTVPVQHTSSFALDAPAPPPADGIDVDSRDPLPGWDALRQDGVHFAYLKATEGTYFWDDGSLPDSEPGGGYPDRYADARTNHFLVGAYHYATAREFNAPLVTLADAPAYLRRQADYFADHIGRAPLGDLPPSLDFEHRNMVTAIGKTWQGPQWRDPLEAFLDRLEVRLGRVPVIYTSVSIWDDAGLTSAAGFERFADYPLWVVTWWEPAARRFARRVDNNPRLPTPWSDVGYSIWQYSGDFTPREFANLAATRKKSGQPKEIDADVVVTGGVHALRGLAGLGTPAYYGDDAVRVLAYAEEGGEIKALQNLGFWQEANVTELSGGWKAAGDVAACNVGDRSFIAFRSRNDDHVYELTGDAANPQGTPTAATDVTGMTIGVGDPVYVTSGGDRALVYWGFDDHLYVAVNIGGTWQPTLDVNNGAGIVDTVTGAATLFVTEGDLHIAGRMGREGHLVVATLRGAFQPGSQWDRNPVDITARAGAPPATYRPTTYAGADASMRIVYRALRGHIHEIDSTYRDTDLSQAAGAPTCAGNPSAFVLDSIPHVVYRRPDGLLQEIVGDGAGGWTTGMLPCAEAAADPAVTVGSDAAYVGFRGRDGGLHQAIFKAGAWQCQPIEPTRT